MTERILAKIAAMRKYFGSSDVTVLVDRNVCGAER
jgi:hypothetical protein